MDATSADAELTREVCAAALNNPELSRIDRRVGARSDAWRLLAAVTEEAHSIRPLRDMKAELHASDVPADGGLLERYLLLRAALAAIPRLPEARIPADVHAAFCEEFRYFAAEPDAAARFDIGHSSFVSMCKIATLRRFPAGQFQWEISGIPRSDLLAVPVLQLPRAAAFVAFRMHGRAPILFSHLNWRRPNKSLLEDEANRSYHRMARTLELQPEMLGFAACSWFRSPATHRVSPHLAWLSRTFIENGGFVAEAGADKPDSGALYRSATRKRLFDSGQFKPTKGLVMWPRKAMIAWAHAHPEFAA